MLPLLLERLNAQELRLGGRVEPRGGTLAADLVAPLDNLRGLALLVHRTLLLLVESTRLDERVDDMRVAALHHVLRGHTARVLRGGVRAL